MQNRKLEKELDLLNTYLKYLNNVDIRFIAFSNTTLKDKTYKVKNGKWSALKKEIESTIYDGGTDYNIVFNNSNYGDSILLFSDGLLSLCEDNFKSIKPIFINTSLEIYPKESKALLNDFSISGKNFSKNDTLELNFGFGNEIDQTITLNLNKNLIENKESKRFWAQKKLQHLETNTSKNKEVITQLGLDYNLVTDFTSLIVLDNVRDYIRFKITPPEEL